MFSKQFLANALVGATGALTLISCATRSSTGTAETKTSTSTAASTQTSAATEGRAPASTPPYILESFPIPERLIASGAKLAEGTVKWMEKWREMNLEDTSLFQFNELSGSTSINLKIEKIVTKEDGGLKGYGSYVARNGAGNPNSEIAFFNMAAILGFDHIYRPAARYELGPVAAARLRALMESTKIRGSDRLENKTSILSKIASGNPVKGCVKAKKNDNVTLDEIASPSTPPNGAPRSNHPIIALLQASNAQPTKGKALTLKSGWIGDEFELAREYSIIMTLDSVFQQWDRYSGGNVVIQKDKEGHAHFYATDNGGADLGSKTSWEERNLGWFSRYDRDSVAKLREIRDFLKEPTKFADGYLGYTDPKAFVTDLGLYFEMTPEVYVERLRRNLDLFLVKVDAVVGKYGEKAYLE